MVKVDMTSYGLKLPTQIGFGVFVCIVCLAESFGQTLDETWTVTVAGQSVQVNPDGSFLLPNIASPDLFGAAGPGSAPDFLGDDFVRLVGFSTVNGATRYVFSDPFQIRQGEVYRINNLTFTNEPPPLPESIRVSVGRQTLTSVGESTPLQVTGILGNGREIDVTPRTMWTIYRISNPDFATVDADGVVTAVAKGTTMVTAVNEGATSVIRVDVSPGDPLTTVEGFVQFGPGVGASLEGISISLPSFGRQVTTQANGFFRIPDIPTLIDGTMIVTARVQIEGAVYIGVAAGLTRVSGGTTDAGILELIEGGLDLDFDGIPDALEPSLGYDPALADSDEPPNGVIDGNEDLDGDTLTNIQEVVLGTNLASIDSDRDGVMDNVELTIGTFPLARDSDGDGWPDGVEVDDETDPVDPSSQPSQTWVSRPPISIPRPPADGRDGIPVIVAYPPVQVRKPSTTESDSAVIVGRPPIQISPIEAIDASGGVTVSKPPVAIENP